MHNMKTSLLKSLVVLGACWLVTSPALAEQKFGTVNMQKIFDGYWKTRQSTLQLRERGDQFKKDLDVRLENYKKANSDYKKLFDSANDQAVTSEERDRRKKAAEVKSREVQDLEAQLTQFNTNMRETLDGQKKRMRDVLLRAIQGMVGEKAKAAGYTMIFDTAPPTSEGLSVVVYTSGENDLTDAVLKELNQGAPAEFLKPLPAPAPAPGK